MKTVESVLLDLGVEEYELEHFISCDKCVAEGGMDGIEIYRCLDNPLQQIREWEIECYHIAWSLFDFWEIPRLSHLSMKVINKTLEEIYKPLMIEQINQMSIPLFFRELFEKEVPDANS